MDFSGIITRDEIFAMKQRMTQRGAHVDALLHQQNPSNNEEAHPSNPGPTTTQNIDRCRSLKDRIHDRLVRPQSMSGAPYLYEGTKDLYTHEMPFPVNTVYEVQQIPNPASVAIETRNGHVPQTLLLAAESAALVQTLEDRLGNALRKISMLENDLELEKTQKETLSTRLTVADKEILALNARNEELQKQAEAIRKECQLNIDNIRKDHAEQIDKVTKGERTNGASAVKKVEETSKVLEERIKTLTSDKSRLEEMVSELKNQLSQNAQSLQISTQTVKSLTHELLQAKQQSTFVSSGYKKLEMDLRAANALIVTKDTELTVTRASAKELAALKETHSKASIGLAEKEKKLAAFGAADEENKKLKEALAKMEKEMAEKDARLGELKSHVDQVRQQANAAYLHAKGFAFGDDGMYGSGSPMMSGGMQQPCPVHGATVTNTSVGGVASGASNPAIAEALRREIEIEGNRFKEETKRWKQRLEQSPTRVR